MSQDAQGHHLSGATEAAVAGYDQAVRAFNLVHGDSIGLFDAARAAAPDFAMAHLGKAWVFAVSNDPGLLAQASVLVEEVRPLRLNEREAAHFAALSHLVRGARSAAVVVMDRHLMHYPFDLLGHQGAALVDGFLGRFHWVRDRSARALPLWSKERPGYGTMLAFHGFGLGWMAAREALWSTPSHPNQVHIWWHKALFHVELGQYEAALAVYDGPMRATQRRLGVSLTNASALLWRLDTLGCDIGDRWRDLASLWDGHADGKCLVFTDIHAAMAELRSGQEALVERRLEAMRETAESEVEAAGLYRTVGIPVVEALRAFHRGAYDEAVTLLLQTRVDLWQIGGSHAQRDVVDWTLAEAAVRAGQREVALALAHERLGARPRSAPNRRFLRSAEQ